jgi:hypothetical protein
MDGLVMEFSAQPVRETMLHVRGLPFEFPNTGVGLAQLSGGHHFLTNRHRVAARDSERRDRLRITFGTMLSSRLIYATVLSPTKKRWIGVFFALRSRPVRAV